MPKTDQSLEQRLTAAEKHAERLEDTLAEITKQIRTMVEELEAEAQSKGDA